MDGRSGASVGRLRGGYSGFLPLVDRRRFGARLPLCASECGRNRKGYLGERGGLGIQSDGETLQQGELPTPCGGKPEALGHDVQTTRDAGKDGLAVPNNEVLEHAANSIP